MRPGIGIVLFGCLPWLAGLAPAQDKTPLADAQGNPLPTGAVARLGAAGTHYNGQAVALAVSPDGKIAALFTDQRAGLYLWDVDTSKLLRQVEGAGSVRTCAFAPDGKWLAAGTQEEDGGRLFLWDVAKGKLLRTLSGHDGPVLAVAWTGDGKQVVSVGADAVVRWWSAATGMPLRTWESYAGDRRPGKLGRAAAPRFASAVLSGGGRVLVAQVSQDVVLPSQDAEGHPRRSQEEIRGRTDRWLVAWALPQGKELWQRGVLTGPQVLAVSADNRVLAHCGTALAVISQPGVPLPVGGAPVLRHVLTAAEVDLLSPMPTHDVRALVLTAKGNRVAAVTEDGIFVWPVGAGRSQPAVVNLAARSGADAVAVFLPDGKRLLAAAAGRFRVLDAKTLRGEAPFPGHADAIDYLRFSDDGRKLLSGSHTVVRAPELILTWDTTTWKPAARSELLNVLAKYDAHEVSLEQNVLIGPLRPGPGKPAWPVQRVGGAKPAFLVEAAPVNPDDQLLSFSPDGKLLLLSRTDVPDPHGAVYDVGAGRQLGKVLMRDRSGDGWTASPDRKRIAWECKDGTVRVADIATGAEVARFGKPGVDPGVGRTVLVFSPDGQLLAAWDRVADMLRIWQVATGMELFTVPAREAAAGAGVPSVAFAPDGRLLAVGGRDGGGAQLWDVKAGKLRGRVQGHSRPVTAVAFSPDGRWLASGSADATILVWDVVKIAN
jgi:WD40 repeat protein